MKNLKAVIWNSLKMLTFKINQNNQIPRNKPNKSYVQNPHKILQNSVEKILRNLKLMEKYTSYMNWKTVF